jgi:hypothetical protein
LLLVLELDLALVGCGRRLRLVPVPQEALLDLLAGSRRELLSDISDCLQVDPDLLVLFDAAARFENIDWLSAQVLKLASRRRLSPRY